MAVLIDNRQSLLPIQTEQINRQARAILNALGCPEGELSLVIVDDAEIAVINRQYLDRNGPTNVISFAMREGDCSGIHPELLGDVVISAETARREAEAAGMAVAERITELLVHGVLHLFGYDHETPTADAAAMEAKSMELLAMLAALSDGDQGPGD
ncbi:MAG: rRNA maturation RNase YbeY [Desulfobacteraceae bacterium]|jgi:probable rRNA maturation factor|nr:rRNA maturation RNase YbeY [Desulfobacteraceae bacterium]